MEIKFKVNSFKRMENPYDLKSERTKYLCYVNVKEIPNEFEEWMLTNPREQKLTTNVAKSIEESLKNNKRDFHELNRGIVMSAEKVKYDNQTKEVTITFNDELIHGNIDGGHTLKIILANKANLIRDKYVFMEIFTGIENTIELAEARNTSVQVTQASIEELKQSFQCIKDVIKDEDYANRISYKQNELQDERNKIDVREVIAIINMFNQQLYPTNDLNISHPIQSYTGKEASLNAYLKIDKNDRDIIINNMKDVIPKIFELWDKIETEFDNKGKKAKKIYKTKKYSKYNEGNIIGYSLFGNKAMDYALPRALIYPVVGAFRALIEVDSESNKYRFKKDPIEAWEKLGPDLVKTILNASTDLGDTPDTIAKSPNTWDILYKAVLIYSIYK